MKVEMHFYATKTVDSNVHVQNVVMGLMGQHHVHTPKGFEKWIAEIDEQYLHISDGECSCGLQPGQVRSHSGKVTFNEEFK